MEMMKKILLVEDEPIAEIVNTKLLRDLGYEPDIAKTGEAAVNMCKNNESYHIVFMDIGLPGIDGLEATRQIRAHEACSNRRSRIIALTAYTISDYRDKCLQAGLDDIANKPITIDKLKSLIEGNT